MIILKTKLLFIHSANPFISGSNHCIHMLSVRPYITTFQNKQNKTEVINDPLGQPTVPAGSDCRLILKFWDGRTDTLCENNDHVFGRGLVGQLLHYPELLLPFWSHETLLLLRLRLRFQPLAHVRLLPLHVR